MNSSMKCRQVEKILIENFSKMSENWTKIYFLLSSLIYENSLGIFSTLKLMIVVFLCLWMWKTFSPHFPLISENYSREKPRGVNWWSKNISLSRSSPLQHHQHQHRDMRRTRPNLFLDPSRRVCCICQCYRVFSVARIVNRALRSEKIFLFIFLKVFFHRFLSLKKWWNFCELGSDFPRRKQNFSKMRKMLLIGSKWW